MNYITNGVVLGYVDDHMWSNIQKSQNMGIFYEFTMQTHERNPNGGMQVNMTSYIRGLVSKNNNKWQLVNQFDGNDVMKTIVEGK